MGWPSPVIRILAQRRLVRVVGGGSGSEARMRRSRRVLGVEAVLWERGSLGSEQLPGCDPARPLPYAQTDT